MKKQELNIAGLFNTEILSEKEMSEVRGGTRPKTRDRDVYDLDEGE